MNFDSQPFKSSCTDSVRVTVSCAVQGGIIHLAYFLPSEMFQFSKKDVFMNNLR